jgi:glutamine amidotransferase
MCRLYAFRSNEPTKVECSLVYAQNALLTQSISDLRGEAHPHGWGISWYEDGLPSVEKKDTAAHQDENFNLMAERVYAKSVIAHVRQATVGEHSLLNTHPFIFGPWTFVHNGTLGGFDQLEEILIEETDTDLLQLRHGETDSELIFYWLMSRLRRTNGNGGTPVPDHKQLLEVLGESTRLLEDRARATPSKRTTRLNFLLTNGRILAATRLRNSLFQLVRSGIRDCEICGIPHVHQTEHTRYRAVILASEPISDEEWEEVPDFTAVGVNEQLQVSHLAI